MIVRYSFTRGKKNGTELKGNVLIKIRQHRETMRFYKRNNVKNR